jgi:hypothetical protein
MWAHSGTAVIGEISKLPFEDVPEQENEGVERLALAAGAEDLEPVGKWMVRMNFFRFCGSTNTPCFFRLAGGHLTCLPPAASSLTAGYEKDKLRLISSRESINSQNANNVIVNGAFQ